MKRQILASVFFLLLANFAIAQLSVKNSAYVFVKDEIVFVEDDVSLINTSSRIYLREEGQLIQGTGTTGNSGVGELSVYQEGNVGPYEYNYWCSPIGSKTSNNANNPFGISFLNDATGLITCTPATSNHESNYNGTSSPLNIEPYWIWKYVDSSGFSGWTHVEDNTTINPGEGFTMKGTTGSGDAQRYDFRGKPNTGTISVAVSNNNISLVGNPYPSAMDALAYIHDSQNASVITGTLHYWEQDSSINSHYLTDYEGGYATYTINSDGTLETYVPATFSTYDSNGNINGSGSGGPSGKRPRRYIPIGQGFMVEGTASGVVRAKNSHRDFVKETATDSEFFKNSNTKNKTTKSSNNFDQVPADYKRFRLNIDFNNAYTRQLVETFNESATAGFDYGMESGLSEGEFLGSDAYWMVGGKSYVAEALPFEYSLKIPLFIRLAQKWPVRIRITDIQNFDSQQPIYLHDKENYTYVNLKDQDYEITLEKGNYTDRFEITFMRGFQQTLDTENTAIEDFKVFENVERRLLEIHNPKLLEITSVSLFDVSGKNVLNRNLSSIKPKHAISTKQLSNGVYIVFIQTTGNQKLNKKVLISGN